MKKFLYLAISTLLLILLTPDICLAVPDSCLTLIWPNSPPDSYNPDYIKKDTCKDSPTYGEWYQRGTWLILMDYYIFKNLIPKTHSAYLEDIDSTKYPIQKEAYRILENKFGKISFFRDPSEYDNKYDSEFIKYPVLDVEFSRYNRRYEQLDSLRKVPGTIFAMTKPRNSPYLTDVEENINNNKPFLFPNPCNDKLILKLFNYSICDNNNLIIYNYLGNPILTYDIAYGENTFEIDIKELNEGIYFIKLNNNFLKFIKLR